MNRLMTTSVTTPAAGSAAPPIKPSHEYVYSTHFRMYLQEGEEFRLYMNPLLYMRQDSPEAMLQLSESERRFLLVSLLQERLRKLLYIFLHGHELPELARVLVLFGDRSGDRLAVELRALDFLARELRDCPDIHLEQSRAVLPGVLMRPRPAATDVARVIATFYREIAPVFAAEGRRCEERTIAAVPAYDESVFAAASPRYFRPLIELGRYLGSQARPFLRAAYLQGSHVTLEHVPGFSDVETLLVVSRESVCDEEALLRLQSVVVRSMPYVYRMDPFQHHGHFILTEPDLDWYPQAFMPLTGFAESRAFFGGEDFTLRERDSAFEQRRAIWDLCYYSRRRHLEHSPARNFYEWRAHLATLLLIPAAYLAARGTWVPKRESFARAARDFEPETWDVIERVTAVRASWTPDRSPALGRLAGRVPTSLVRGLWPWAGGHAGGKLRDVHGMAGREGTRRAFEFCEAVLTRLKQEGAL